MDEPCSALDPQSTLRIEELISELKERLTIIIVTHNMQQAARVSDFTAFFTIENEGEPGRLIEHGATEQIFSQPAAPPHRGLRHRPLRLSRTRAARRRSEDKRGERGSRQAPLAARGRGAGLVVIATRREGARSGGRDRRACCQSRAARGLPCRCASVTIV